MRLQTPEHRPAHWSRPPATRTDLPCSFLLPFLLSLRPKLSVSRSSSQKATVAINARRSANATKPPSVVLCFTLPPASRAPRLQPLLPQHARPQSPTTGAPSLCSLRPRVAGDTRGSPLPRPVRPQVPQRHRSSLRRREPPADEPRAARSFLSRFSLLPLTSLSRFLFPSENQSRSLPLPRPSPFPARSGRPGPRRPFAPLAGALLPATAALLASSASPLREEDGPAPSPASPLTAPPPPPCSIPPAWTSARA